MALYLTGSVTEVRPLLDEQRLGYMNTPANRHRMNGWVWAADNGCYGKNYVGDERWFAWLSAFPEAERNLCLFATAPDVVGDSSATLERSRPWLPMIRGLGFRAALVAQDGLTLETCPWDEFDVLFIGGTTEWKLGSEARSLIAAAKQHNKPVHVGRVNSRRRYQAMAALGVDSVDGTFIAFGPRVNAPTVIRWTEEYQMQPPLFRALDGEQG